jgi:low temperature requirement protein LtrA
VWAANAQATTSRALRAILLIATVAVFVTGLSLPRAFKGEATLFASSYAVVRLLHLALYADASRKGDAAWSAIAGFAVTVVIGMALLLGGSFATGALRYGLWGAAVAIDYAGPAWLTRQRLRGLQRVAVAHFAERYSLFVIICLGESIVAVGVAAAAGGRRALTTPLVAAVALGLMTVVGMWWTYFDRFAARAQAHLRAHPDPVLAAADAYSYLHLVIVAGIIVFAVGVKLLAAGAVDSPLPAPARLALTGGVALYLLGQVAVGLRLFGRLSWAKSLVAAGLLLLFAVGGGLPAWSLAAAVMLLVAVVSRLESATERPSGQESAPAPEFRADGLGKDRLSGHAESG